MSKTIIRHIHISLFAKLSLVLSVVLSSVSLATADEQTLLTSTQMKVNTYKVSTLFHQLTLQEGDTTVQEKLEEAISSMNDLRDNLSSLESPESADDIQESVAVSKDYLHFAAQNEIATEGFTSQYAITDLHQARFNLLSALERIISKEKEVQGSSSKYDLYDTAALLQQMTSDYVRRSVSTGGAGMYVEGEEKMATPDIMAEEFNARLQKITQAHQGNAQVAKLIKSIDRKWRFIEPSFKSYNTNTVPFLVSKYCDIIVIKLSEVAEAI